METGPGAAERAERRLEGIKSHIDECFDDALESASKQLEDEARRINENIKKILQDNTDTLTQQVKERFQSVFALDVGIDKPQLEFSNLLDQQLERIAVTGSTGTRYEWRNKEGVGNRIAQLLGDLLDENWGKERIAISEDRAVIDLRDLRDAAMRGIGAFERSLNQQTRDYTGKKLQPAVDEYFKKIETVLAQLQGDAKDSLSLQSHSREENDALNKVLCVLMDQIEISTADTEAMQQALG